MKVAIIGGGIGGMALALALHDAGLAAGYRWPQVSIHRGELLGILHRAVLARLGPARLRTGHHLARLGQAGDRVRAEFVDRASGAAVGRAEADLLVACDGIHSVV